MEIYKYVSDDNLLYIWQKIKLLLNNKVDKENGKSLFSGFYNDVLNKPQIAGVSLEGNKSLEDLGIIQAINDAIGDITGIEFQVVNTLPDTGESGIIYLVPHSHDSSDIYDEYIYYNDTYEKIGSTDIDLSNYIQTTDLVELTNAEIDTIMAN